MEESLWPAMVIYKVAVPGHLHQKRLPLHHLTLPVINLIEQIDIAVFVDPHLATDQVRNGDGDLTAAGPFRDHVDEFLRKRVEHDAPRALAPFACDCIESGEPVARILRFPFGPLPDEMNHVPHLLPGAFLVPIERRFALFRSLNALRLATRSSVGQAFTAASASA